MPKDTKNNCNTVGGRMKVREIISNAVKLHDSQSNVASMLDMDQGDFSRVLAGDKGLKLEALDKLLAAVDMVIISRDRLNKIMSAYDLIHELYQEERRK